MEILLLCLLGAVTTWAVVDAVRDDDEDETPNQVEEPEPTPSEGLNLQLLEDGTYNGTGAEDNFTVAPPQDGDEAYKFSGVINSLAGNDSITGSFDEASIKAGSGDDHFNGVLDNSTLSGDRGDDLIEVEAIDSNINGGDGNDTITGTAHDSDLRGGSGDDTLDLVLENSVLGAGEGNDSITATLNENSVVRGGPGDDEMILKGDSGTVFGDDGNDVIDARDLMHGAVYGGNGDDTLYFAPSNSEEGGISLFGGEGDDIFEARLSTDQQNEVSELSGGAGADIYNVNLSISENSPQTPEGNLLNDIGLISIKDFEPGVDKLRLQITGNYSEVDLIERADGSGSDLGIRFTGTDQDEVSHDHWAYIYLEGASDLTLADLEITTVPAPALPIAA